MILQLHEFYKLDITMSRVCFQYNSGHTNIVLSTFDNPANINPYFMNTAYRRPTNTESDLGYSTMTPHEDSEQASITCVDSVVTNRDRYRPPTTSKSKTAVIAEGTILPPPPHGNPKGMLKFELLDAKRTMETDLDVRIGPPSQTRIVSEQTMLLPHQVIANVQVHIVDAH